MHARWKVSLFALLLAVAAPACGSPPPAAPAAPSTPPPFTVVVSGAGRPVVFLPDLEAPGDVWDTTVAHLGGHYQTYVVNVAGFAGTPAPAPGTVIPALRDGLARYLRDHQVRGAIVVGHMFGATVAYSLALSDPELVGGVVAVDALPTVADGDPKEVQAEAEGGRQGLSTATPEKFALMTRHRLASMMANADTAARISAEAVRSSQRTVADAFYEMMTLDLRPRLGALKPPVLVIGTMGNQEPDQRAGFEARWHKQVDLIPRHTLVIVPTSKHYVMFDDPPAFFGPLDRFLETK